MPEVPVNGTYRGNMVCIKFSYDFEIILPLEDANALLQILGKAEIFKSNYPNDPYVEPMNKEISVRFLARTVYERLKLNFLRNDGNETH